jgi:DNA-binding beta-propeller fold protein YncE
MRMDYINCTALRCIIPCESAETFTVVHDQRRIHCFYVARFVMQRRISYLFLLFSSLIILMSCASQKALIDHTAREKIFWPGPPEKPRIAYLWNVSLLSGDAGARAVVFFAGDDDLTDPKTSGRLLRPYAIFVDEQETVYVADPGAFRITIIDPKTGDTRNIVKAGAEEFISPVGIAAFQEKIYVSDSFLNKVFILSADGTRISEFQGEFRRSTALALDRNNGIIYVSDTLAHFVYQYDLNGKRLGVIGGNGSEDGQFNFPTHLWVDRAGRLYVTDAMNFRIQIFSPDGAFEDKFGILGDAYGHLDKPKGVATDSDGNIYVVDSIKDMVKIFNRDGKLLLFFGKQGRDVGQFWLPSGIFIDMKNRIYVADTYNGRIQAFSYLGGEQ